MKGFIFGCSKQFSFNFTCLSLSLQELLENHMGIEWFNLLRNVRMIVGNKHEREKTDDRKEQKTEKS